MLTMLQRHTDSVERDALRWEDAIKSREEWVRCGWVTPALINQEIAWYKARAAQSRYLLNVINGVPL